mmetsp:Transcript_2814/g.8224  ORF Transcript_2814/g.8224 Transcript_2814/m.8224 type:complete len:351 (+) Transcript_2814:843-1895(+)
MGGARFGFAGSLPSSSESPASKSSSSSSSSSRVSDASTEVLNSVAYDRAAAHVPFARSQSFDVKTHLPNLFAPRPSTFQPLSLTKRNRAWNSFSLACGPAVVFRQNQPLHASHLPDSMTPLTLASEISLTTRGFFVFTKNLDRSPRFQASAPKAQAPLHVKRPVLSMVSLPLNNDSGASSGFAGGASTFFFGGLSFFGRGLRFFLGFGAAFSRASGSASGAVHKSVMTALIVFLKGFSRASSTSNLRAARSRTSRCDDRPSVRLARNSGSSSASSSTALRTCSSVTSAMVSRGSAVSSGRGDVAQASGPGCWAATLARFRVGSKALLGGTLAPAARRRCAASKLVPQPSQ